MKLDDVKKIESELKEAQHILWFFGWNDLTIKKTKKTCILHFFNYGSYATHHDVDIKANKELREVITNHYRNKVEQLTKELNDLGFEMDLKYGIM